MNLTPCEPHRQKRWHFVLSSAVPKARGASCGSRPDEQAPRCVLPCLSAPSSHSERPALRSNPFIRQKERYGVSERTLCALGEMKLDLNLTPCEHLRSTTLGRYAPMLRQNRSTRGASCGSRPDEQAPRCVLPCLSAPSSHSERPALRSNPFIRQKERYGVSTRTLCALGEMKLDLNLTPCEPHR